MTGPTGFAALWNRTLEQHGDRIALWSPTWGSTTYAAVHAQAEALAQGLRDAGVRPGHLVGIRTADRYRFCLGLLGSWFAGAVPVPLAATAPDSYVQEIAARAGTATVLVDAEDGGSLTPCGRPAPGARLVGAAAYVMHTSGSTGRPKGVLVSHRALTSYCSAFTAAVGLTAADRFLQLAPLTFDVCLEELLPVWTVGGTAVLAPQVPDDPAGLLDEVERLGVTVAELTTVYWKLLVRYLRASGRPVPASLRLLLMGGEQASAELMGESLLQGLPMAHVYGVTEAAITSTVRVLEPCRPVATASVGKPLANSTVWVVDAGGRPVPPGATGEVWIGGEGLAEGYLGDPDATASRFVEATAWLPPGRYYRTGDLGRLDADGELEVLGRMDFQTKVKGVRVDPSELEACLASSPLVADSAAVAVEGLDGTTRLVAFAVAANAANRSTLPSVLLQFLRDRVPEHLLPDRVLVLDALPVTAHGKVDRAQLREWGADSVAGPGLEGLTATERLVESAWTAAVGRPPDSVDQGFADAGGDSLAVLALVVGLGEVGVTVTAGQCLSCPTVRTLAALIDSTPANRSEDPEMLRDRVHGRREHLSRRRRGGS